MGWQLLGHGGPSLDNPVESFKLRLNSRLHAVLFSKQVSDPSSVREPAAVARVCWDGLVGHGGEPSRGAKQAPLWVLVWEECGKTAVMSQVLHGGTPGGTNRDQYLALSHEDLRSPCCGLSSSCISLVTHSGLRSALFM